MTGEALRWVGTPWHHNAAVLGAGVDCGRLLVAAYSAAGLVEAPDLGRYPADWMMHRSEEVFLGWVERYMRRVSDPLPGDAVVWRFGRCYSHGAVVVEWPRVVHAYRPSGCVCEGDGLRDPFAWLSDGVRRPALFYTPKEAA